MELGTGPNGTGRVPVSRPGDGTGLGPKLPKISGTGRDRDGNLEKLTGRDGTGTGSLGTAGRPRPVASRIIFIIIFCLKFPIKFSTVRFR